MKHGGKRHGFRTLYETLTMNIFVTDPDPIKSAVVLPDKHIVKMPLETCQMSNIVCSDKWGHGFGSLPKSDGTPNDKVPSVTTPIRSG